jgi:hypothetical protein
MEHKNIIPQWNTKTSFPNGTQKHHSPMEHKNIIPQRNTKTLGIKKIPLHKIKIQGIRKQQLGIGSFEPSRCTSFALLGLEKEKNINSVFLMEIYICYRQSSFSYKKLISYFSKLKVDVFKHMQAVVTRKLSMFKRNYNNNSPSTSMAEELKPFAGTLLYLLEKMQKNLSKLESSKNGIKQSRRKKRGTKTEIWKKFWEQNRRKKRGTKMEIWKKFWEVVGALIICALIVLTLIVVCLSMKITLPAAVILSIIITAVLLAAAIGCSQSNNC